MNFSEYQDKASTTAIYPKQLTGGVYYAAIGLAGEVGELLNKIKKIARDNAPIDKDAIAGELGDVLWYVSQMATELGIEMDDVAKHNLEKLSDRKNRGKISGNGDYR
ncbi:MAG: nucleoside triphosphate pyrophosphohydrolase family protein [Candidatus Micrarchaeaceae archaeon]